jgi:hypothetical protein
MSFVKMRSKSTAVAYALGLTISLFARIISVMPRPLRNLYHEQQ